MPRLAKPLTDPAIRHAKPGLKPRRLFDGEGLHLLINPDGGKYWRLKYLFDGKEKRIGLGVYPKVTLAEARNKAIKERRKLKDGSDPATERQAEKQAKLKKAANTFKAVALEWYERKRAEWAPATARKVNEALMIDLIPSLGQKSIAELTGAEVIEALRLIESRSPHMAHKARQYCGAIVRYACRNGKREEHRLIDLRDSLNELRESHFKTFDEKDLPGFIEKLGKYKGALQTRIALKLLMHLFVRPSEMAGARWAEFDLDAAEWRIPAERMKMKHPHIVPLAKQVVELLKELYPLTGHTPFLFPGERAPHSQPMARDTFSKAMRSMGYQGKATPHGFRAMASTMLNEMGFDPDVIERQLAHKEPNKIRAAYNRAQYLTERTRMMQHWADYLGGLAKGGKIVAFKKSAA